MGAEDRLSSIALRALATEDFKDFSDALAVQTYPESFAILCQPEVVAAMSPQLGTEDSVHWIQDELTWNVSAYGSTTTLLPAQQLLHHLWQDLSSRLVLKLDSLGRQVPLGRYGAVHCFFGCAALSVVVAYRHSAARIPTLIPIDVRLAPTAAVELTNMLVDAAPRNRNVIKRVSHSVDKIIYQRGTICHVHRLQESDVFGPTIDTVILGDVLAELIESPSVTNLSALELGAGSGLLTTIMAASDKTSELTAIDLNGAAVTCTIKNLSVNGMTLDAKHQVIRVRAERFQVRQLAGPYDLVVCNPPYIPDPPGGGRHGAKEYRRAVGGLDLCFEILGNLETLIGQTGRLLMMTSSMSQEEVLAAIPLDYVSEPALVDSVRRVPLDVDTIWEDAGWRNRLVAVGRIEEDEKGDLWHELRPVWINRRKAQL